MLAGAVVEDALGRAPLLEPELELVLARGGLGEQGSGRGDLLRRGAVRGGGDGEVPRVEVAAGARERQRLHRLRRGAHEAGQRLVPGDGDDLSVVHGDRVHAVPRLDGPVAPHLDDDGLHRAEPTWCPTVPRPWCLTRSDSRHGCRADSVTDNCAAARARERLRHAPPSSRCRARHLPRHDALRLDERRCSETTSTACPCSDRARTPPLQRSAGNASAFCFMTTHYHLILETFDESLPARDEAPQSPPTQHASTRRHGLRGHVVRRALLTLEPDRAPRRSC